jgi:hypothetical protein
VGLLELLKQCLPSYVVANGWHLERRQWMLDGMQTVDAQTVDACQAMWLPMAFESRQWMLDGTQTVDACQAM